MKNKNQNIVIIELFNFIYKEEKNALKYENASDNATTMELSSEFVQGSLVMNEDNFGLFDFMGNCYLEEDSFAMHLTMY